MTTRGQVQENGKRDLFKDWKFWAFVAGMIGAACVSNYRIDANEVRSVSNTKSIEVIKEEFQKSVSEIEKSLAVLTTKLNYLRVNDEGK